MRVMHAAVRRVSTLTIFLRCAGHRVCGEAQDHGAAVGQHHRAGRRHSRLRALCLHRGRAT